MPYSNKIYKKAERILEKRRDDAVMSAEIRVSDIKDSIPEIDEIQTKLSRIGLEISKIFFYKGDTDEKLKQLRNESETLVEQRSLILKKHGYKEDAMQVQHVCSACGDRGFINGRLCNCHKQILKDIMRDEIGKIAPLGKCTFDNFSLDYYSETPNENSIIPRRRAQIALEKSREYAQNFSLNSKNLLFIGGTGLGKTHLSLAIINVVVNKGYYVCYGTSQNICDDLQSEQFGRDEDTYYYTKRQVLDCDLLVIDDLGTEVENQYSMATLYNVINTRILSKKPTIISTNYNYDALEKKYDKRITSRINGEYLPFYFIGSDIRNL
jgi:DNA replication protein DnaC